MITLALGVILITLLIFLLVKAHRVNQTWAKKGIKHLKPWPIIGNNLPLILGTKSNTEIILELYETFPNEPVIGFYDFMTPRLFVRDGELINKVLIKDFGHFTDHGITLDFEKNPRDETLFVMNGNRWRAFRTKMTPIFTTGKLREMFSTMTSVGENLLDFLKERQHQEIDIREMMGLFSMDVISSAVFGMDPATLKNPDCEFRKKGVLINDQSIPTLLRIYLSIAFPKLVKFLGISFQNQAVMNFFCNIIRSHFQYRKEKGVQRNDFVQMMMQLKEKGKVEIQDWEESDDYLKSDDSGVNIEKFEITEDVLLAQAQLFMTAGFEATALVMTFATFELTQQKDFQEKLREEIKEQIKLHGGFNYDAVKNMKLLECTIKEAQRLYPLVPALFRSCTKPYELPDGYIIEKDVAVSVPVSAVHLDPNNFKDPKLFRPERFLEPIKPGTFLPFGDGPRMCIAMRYTMLVMMYGMALMLLNYRVSISENTPIPLQFNKRSFGIFPKGKILIKVEKIES